MESMPAVGSGGCDHRTSGRHVDLQAELHRGATLVNPREENVPVRRACCGCARIGHGGAGPHQPEGEQELPLGGEAPLAVLRDGPRLDVDRGDRLRHAGKRDPRAGLFVQQEGEGILLSRAVVHGRWHPLKCGHTPGDRSCDVSPRARGGGTSHDDDKQADEAVLDA